MPRCVGPGGGCPGCAGSGRGIFPGRSVLLFPGTAIPSSALVCSPWPGGQLLPESNKCQVRFKCFRAEPNLKTVTLRVLDELLSFNTSVSVS